MIIEDEWTKIMMDGTSHGKIPLGLQMQKSINADVGSFLKLFIAKKRYDNYVYDVFLDFALIFI
jgi:hypothetical protein